MSNLEHITRKILHPLYVSLIRINRRDTPSDKDVLGKLPGEVLRQTTWWDQVQSKLVLWIIITEHLEISTVVIDNCVLSKQVRLIAMQSWQFFVDSYSIFHHIKVKSILPYLVNRNLFTISSAYFNKLFRGEWMLLHDEPAANQLTECRSF